MPRNIPGFYYDEAKGKYFKIQPNHAVSHGFKYSAQTIKLQQENAEVRLPESVELDFDAYLPTNDPLKDRYACYWKTSL